MSELELSEPDELLGSEVLLSALELELEDVSDEDEDGEGEDPYLSTERLSLRTSFKTRPR
jgi:hypothetical protein